MNLVELTNEINDKIIALRSRLYGITNILLDESNQVKACSTMPAKVNDGIGVTSTLEDALTNLSSMDIVIAGIEAKMGAYPQQDDGGKYGGIEDVKYTKGVSLKEASYSQTARIR